MITHCGKYGHAWTITQHFVVTGFEDEIQLTLKCPVCSKVISGQVNVRELTTEQSKEFYDITDL